MRYNVLANPSALASDPGINLRVISLRAGLPQRVLQNDALNLTY